MKLKAKQKFEADFVVPYSLEECLARIENIEYEAGDVGPGYAPTFKAVAPGLYDFRIRRTWANKHLTGHTATMELLGKLEALDETSTMVQATAHATDLGFIYYAGFGLALIVTAILAQNQGVSGLPLFLVPLFPFGFFCARQRIDKHDLLQTFHYAMRAGLL